MNTKDLILSLSPKTRDRTINGCLTLEGFLSNLHERNMNVFSLDSKLTNDNLIQLLQIIAEEIE